VKNRKTEIKPSSEFERALAQCTPEDFDGHTEFYRLTPEQRLEWLCQAATFVYEFKGKANPGTGNQPRGGDERGVS
jgi:hypothetical protein